MCPSRRKKPKEWARRPALKSMSWDLASEDGEEAVGQLALLARPGRGDEYGVIAGYGADDLRPSGGVDSDRHALRGTHGRFQYRQIRAGRQASVDELLEGREIIFGGNRRLGQHVPVAHFGHAQLAQ